MKKLLAFFLVMVSAFSYAQNEPKITFDYDTAGNQIKRKLCMDCLAKASGNTVKNIEEIKAEDLQKFYPEDVISYYPNPVKEQLYLQWELSEGNHVSFIEVYSLNGQLLKSYKNLQNRNNFIIDFNQLPQNVYSLNLVYINGEHKSIKIVKN